jgi:SnoaL-like protein
VKERDMTQVPVQPTPETDAGQQRAASINRFFAAIQSGDGATLQEVLTPGAITRWPQSGERITGAMACAQIYANYPGGPPKARVERITGSGETWVAELVADYGEERWYTVSVIEFEGDRIARMTDYFGPSFPAPEWRSAWVEREGPAA